MGNANTHKRVPVLADTAVRLGWVIEQEIEIENLHKLCK